MNNDQNINFSKVLLWPQCFAALTATIGGLIWGTCIGWSGPTIALLMNNSSEISVTQHECNFIASIHPAGSVFGALSGGLFINKIGRKGTMMVLTVMFSMAYLILASTQNVWMFYIGRCLTGFTSGVTTIATPTYISEVASPKIRGMLGSAFQLMFTIGIMYSSIIGATTNSWRWLSVSCMFWCLIWSILLLFCPESPLYLLTKKDVHGARQSLKFLRGHEMIDLELEQIAISIEETATRNFNISHIFKNASNWKPLLICLVTMAGQQLSGYNAVIFFSISIFEAAKTPLDSFIENIIITCVQVCATVISTLLIDKLGRRILIMTSAILMIISLYGLGLYFWILDHNPQLAFGISILPLISLCMFIFGFSIGFGPIPLLLMSEMFSPEAKGIASSITSGFRGGLAFLGIEFFVPVKDAIGPAATFWSFAMILVFIVAFGCFFLPETKGKSLDKIQVYFKNEIFKKEVMPSYKE